MFYVGGASGLRNMGTYSTTTTYFPNDLVAYNGNTYLAASVNTNQLPTNTTYWQVMVAASYPKLAGGSGATALLGNVSNKAQTNLYTFNAYQSTATARTLTMDGLSAITLTGTGTNVLLIPYSTQFVFWLTVNVRRYGQQYYEQGFVYTGMVSRASSGTGYLVGSVTSVASWQNNTNVTMAIGVNTTDATNNYLQLTATPTQTATMIMAVLETNEMNSLI